MQDEICISIKVYLDYVYDGRCFSYRAPHGPIEPLLPTPVHCTNAMAVEVLNHGRASPGSIPKVERKIWRLTDACTWRLARGVVLSMAPMGDSVVAEPHGCRHRWYGY